MPLTPALSPWERRPLSAVERRPLSPSRIRLRMRTLEGKLAKASLLGEDRVRGMTTVRMPPDQALKATFKIS